MNQAQREAVGDLRRIIVNGHTPAYVQLQAQRLHLVVLRAPLTYWELPPEQCLGPGRCRGRCRS